MRKALPILAGLLLASGVAGGLARVASMESVEVDHVGAFVRPAALDEDEGPRVLGAVELREGLAAVFEVCARGALDAEVWKDGVAFEVWAADGPHLLRRTELDRGQLARVRAVGSARCMEIARTDRLPTQGAHWIAIDWGEGPAPARIAELPLAARVQAAGSPVRLDRFAYLATLVGAFTALLALGSRRSSVRVGAEAGAPSGSGPGAGGGLRGAWVRIGLGVGALLAAELLLAHLPFAGRTYALVRGLLLAAVQIVAALALVRPPPGEGVPDALALDRPARPLLWGLAAALTGLALPFLATWVQRLLPAAAPSHVATLVVFPSGALAVRLVSAFAPVVEEVFFRGFVYGTARSAAGPAAAFATSVLAFGAVHAPQVAGDPGSLVAIFSVGVVLTALRHLSASTLVPALAHLTYNALL